MIHFRYALSANHSQLYHIRGGKGHIIQCVGPKVPNTNRSQINDTPSLYYLYTTYPHLFRIMEIQMSL